MVKARAQSEAADAGAAGMEMAVVAAPMVGASEAKREVGAVVAVREAARALV